MMHWEANPTTDGCSDGTPHGDGGKGRGNERAALLEKRKEGDFANACQAAR